MTLHPTQAKIAQDRHRFRVLRCGRRWGKTSLCSEEIKGLAISRPAKVAYIANTYQQARDIIWEILKKELAGAIISTNEARLEIKIKTIKNEESLIVLRGWESVENLRGQAFDLIILDEVAQMGGFWLTWQEVLRPTLVDRQGAAIFASTPKGFNHFYDLCNEELKNADFKSFHFKSSNNPVLLKEEIENARNTLLPEVFGQEYEAIFSKTTGLVYKEFNREKHLYSDLPDKEFQKLGGVDFGFVNPAGVIDVRFDGEIFYCENDWYKKGRTERQIAEYVAGCQFGAVYPDPENPSAIKELENLNVNVREVLKTKDSVESGIQKVRELLLAGKLKVNKNCLNLISEFEMYVYPDSGDEKNKPEKPIKANDHLLDALRYIVMMVLPAQNENEKQEKWRIEENRWEKQKQTNDFAI